jgi:hypothetical protein
MEKLDQIYGFLLVENLSTPPPLQPTVCHKTYIFFSNFGNGIPYQLSKAKVHRTKTHTAKNSNGYSSVLLFKKIGGGKYKVIWKGSGAKSYMRKSFLIYEEMHEYIVNI